MCTTMVPATAAEALGMLESAVGAQESALRFLAAQDAAGLPAAAVADQLYVPGGAADTGDAPTDTVYVFTLNDVDTGSAQ